MNITQQQRTMLKALLEAYDVEEIDEEVFPTIDYKHSVVIYDYADHKPVMHNDMCIRIKTSIGELLVLAEGLVDKIWITALDEDDCNRYATMFPDGSIEYDDYEYRIDCETCKREEQEKMNDIIEYQNNRYK